MVILFFTQQITTLFYIMALSLNSLLSQLKTLFNILNMEVDVEGLELYELNWTP